MCMCVGLYIYAFICMYLGNEFPVFNTNNKNENEKSTKQNYWHLIQLIILMHRCFVKTLRERVCMSKHLIFFIFIMFNLIYSLLLLD